MFNQTIHIKIISLASQKIKIATNSSARQRLIVLEQLNIMIIPVINVHSVFGFINDCYNKKVKWHLMWFGFCSKSHIYNYIVFYYFTKNKCKFYRHSLIHTG